jgi:hypothetical protein
MLPSAVHAPVRPPASIGIPGRANLCGVVWCVCVLTSTVHSAGNLTQVVVRGAGHILPHDQPLRGLDLISRFVDAASGWCDCADDCHKEQCCPSDTCQTPPKHRKKNKRGRRDRARDAKAPGHP